MLKLKLNRMRLVFEVCFNVHILFLDIYVIILNTLCIIIKKYLQEINL